MAENASQHLAQWWGDLAMKASSPVTCDEQGCLGGAFGLHAPDTSSIPSFDHSRFGSDGEASGT
jgi:hypothetical protein